MNYRNKKLTQSARHHPCVSCGADDGTIVWAHSNKIAHGKGTGIKAHDLFGAYLCHRCHQLYDQWPDSREERDRWFLLQWERSMIIALNQGYF